jgi:polyhydroxyalkanoate synthesis regulator phasin
MTYERDPILDLEARRRELHERWLVYRKTRNNEGAKTAGWVAIGAIGFAADVALMGGACTIMAAIGAKNTWDHRKEVKRLEKELQSLDQSIAELKDERAVQLKNPEPLNKPAIKAEFSPAAQRKVDGLQARLEELEKSMDKIMNSDPSGKPKHKPAGP